MLIIRQEKSSHYYLKTGEPFYTMRNAAASEREGVEVLRAVTIKDAFKAGAYRSVTNVLGVLDKPGLDDWKQEQCVLSALTLPRLEGETDQDFAKRALADADEQSRKARDAGTRLHELATSWLQTGRIATESGEERLLAPFQAWCNSNLHSNDGLVMPPECVMVNHTHGYAGRVDIPARFADGSIGILDLKGQDVKRDKKTGAPKPAFYDEWAMQLAAYSRCIFADGSYPPPMPWRLLSLVIDRNEPGLYVKEWTDPANPLPSAEPHFQAFLAAAKVWAYYKGGVPGVDLKAT